MLIAFTQFKCFLTTRSVSTKQTEICSSICTCGETRTFEYKTCFLWVKANGGFYHLLNDTIEYLLLLKFPIQMSHGWQFRIRLHLTVLYNTQYLSASIMSNVISSSFNTYDPSIFINMDYPCAPPSYCSISTLCANKFQVVNKFDTILH